MPALYDYRIFISHAWKYGEDYDRLVSMLDHSPWFSFYNYSAPQEKPLALSSSNATDAEIEQAITAKIQKRTGRSCNLAACMSSTING